MTLHVFRLNGDNYIFIKANYTYTHMTRSKKERKKKKLSSLSSNCPSTVNKLRLVSQHAFYERQAIYQSAG